MDVRTVVLIGALLAAALALILALALRRYAEPLRASMALWFRGLLALPLAQFFFALRGEIPDAISIVLANTLLVLGFAGFALGVRRYLGIATRGAWVLVPVLSVPLAMLLFSALWPSYTARVVVVSLALLWLLGMLLVPLRGALHRGGPVGQQVVAVTFGMAALAVLVRLVLQVLAFDPASNLLDANLANLIALVYLAIGPLLASVGFVLMSNERLMDEAMRLSTVDALTSAYSRRALNELSERALAEARRHRRPLSVLMIDADHFKRINDTYGHEAGDEVLIELVRRIRHTLRTEDFVGRIGGEEFVAVLPDTPEEEARQVSERLRAVVARDTFIHNGEEIPFTVSIGVAERDPGEGEFEALLRRADDAMYAAKRAGRNRVVAASEIETVPVV
jgi:diguanylate cyclase (GGDEF)-like protein